MPEPLTILLLIFPTSDVPIDNLMQERREAWIERRMRAMSGMCNACSCSYA